MTGIIEQLLKDRMPGFVVTVFYTCPHCKKIFDPRELKNSKVVGEMDPGNYIRSAECPYCGKRGEYV